MAAGSEAAATLHQETMMILDLAWRNVLRNRERSLLTLIGVLLAVGSFVAMVSLAEGFYRRAVRELKGRDVHVYVVPARGTLLPTGPIGTVGFTTHAIHRDWVKSLASMSEVQQIEGIIRLTWEGRRSLIPVIATDIEKLSDFLPNLRPVEGMMPVEPGEAGVGLGVLPVEFEEGVHQLKIEDTSFKISGRVSGGGFRDFFIYVPMEKLIATRPERGFHEIWIKLKDENLARGVASKINQQGIAQTVALTEQEYLGAVKEFVNYAWFLQFAISMIGILIAVTASMNTMLMSTYERLREFSTMRAIGAPRSVVAWMLTLESIILNLAGGFLGLLFGLIASGVLDRAVGLLLEVPFPLAQVTWQLMLQGLGLSVFVGLVGAAIPCFIIWRLDIVRALRWD